MPHFAGLDVAKGTTSICVVDDVGTVVEEAVAETTPKAIARSLRGAGRRYRRIGMESSDMAAWLYSGLAKAGLPIISIDPRHAHAVLATRYNKTDRNDAQGIAELMRIGTYKPTHIRSRESRRIRALLVARDALVAKRRDVDAVIRALLLGLGVKLAAGGQGSFHVRAAALVTAHPEAAPSVVPLLRVRESLLAECANLDSQLHSLAKADPICRRLATAPGIGDLTALAFRSAVDEPNRFPKSRAIGAHFGLVPRTKQSGGKASQGRITHAGDALTRKLLYLAACSLARPGRRQSWLGEWAKALLARMSYRKAMVAVARKLAVVMHQMWITETDFLWERQT